MDAIVAATSPNWRLKDAGVKGIATRIALVCRSVCVSVISSSLYQRTKKGKKRAAAILTAMVNALVRLVDVAAPVTPKMITITALTPLSCQVMMLNLIPIDDFKRL